MENEDITNELTSMLPGDLMLEILSRVRVKSLVKLSCVNKSWYNLVKNPSFIKMHSLKVEDDSFMMADIKNVNGEMESELLLTRPGSSEPEPWGLTEPGRVTIVGSSNGLVCLTYMDQRFGVRFKVMNPALKKHRYVYKKSSQFRRSMDPSNCISVGFGRDNKSGDFKILRIERVLESEALDLWYSYVYLYSLGSNSWKKIPSSGDLVFKSSICTATIGSCLYWLSSLRNGGRVIRGFDLSSETFHVIPLPESRNLDCVQIVAWKHKLLAAVFSKQCTLGYDMWTISPDQISINNGSWKMKMIHIFRCGEPPMIWTPDLSASFYLPKNNPNCIIHWDSNKEFPKILENVKSCRIFYFRESLVPIMDALERKPVGASEQVRVSKVREAFLYVKTLLSKHLL